MEREKIHLEYLLNATSKSILWTAISTPTGLEGWFADKVQSDDKIVFSFGERQRNAMLKSLQCVHTLLSVFVGWIMKNRVSISN